MKMCIRDREVRHHDHAGGKEVKYLIGRFIEIEQNQEYLRNDAGEDNGEDRRAIFIGSGKRLAERTALGRLIWALRAHAVSYTHLDVYKRQIYQCFSMSYSKYFLLVFYIFFQF